jgi:hypothetical protein
VPAPESTKVKPAGAFRAVILGIQSLFRSGRLWVLGLSFEGALGIVRMALTFGMISVVAQAFARGASSADEGADFADVLDSGLNAVLADRVLLPLLGLWLSVELLGAVLRVLYLSAAVPRLTAVIRGDKTFDLGLIAGAVQGFARGITAGILLVLIELGTSLYRWTLLGAALISLSVAFGTHLHGVRASAAFALALCLSLLISWMLSLYGRIFWVRAIRNGEGSGTLVAAWQAGGLLTHRLSSYLAISAIEFVLVLALSGTVGGAGIALGSGQQNLGVVLGVRMVGTLISAAVAVAAELVGLGAYCALDLDARGELPAPPEPPKPPPPPPPSAPAVAQEVLVAQEIKPPEPEPSPS